MEFNGRQFIVGQDRNEDAAVSHLYEDNNGEPGNPMCARGWNRADGHGYSIFRGHGIDNVCKVCLRRAKANKPSVPSKDRKTKWI